MLCPQGLKSFEHTGAYLYISVEPTEIYDSSKAIQSRIMSLDTHHNLRPPDNPSSDKE